MDPNIKIVDMALDELHPDPNNARTHDQRNLDAIRGSIATFGQVEPLVAVRATGRILGGNGRYEVMRELGWTSAKVVLLDLDDTKATALGLALNRTGELAGWDEERLAELTHELSEHDFSLESIGWNPDELGDIWSPPEPESLPEQPETPRAENQRMHSIRLTEDQREVFNRAAFLVREKTSEHEMTDGRALELICADYLAGL